MRPTNNHCLKLLLAVSLLLVSAPSFSQVPLGSQPVTVTHKQIRMADLFNIIWDQTHMQAFYNDEQLSSDEKIDVRFKNRPLDQVLAIILRPRGLTWYYREETFVIMPAKDFEEKQRKLRPSNTATKMLSIAGTITDKEGSPVIGATVIIKSGTGGCLSDRRGRFGLSVPGDSVTLMVSCIGFQTKVVKTGGGFVDITLTAASNRLDEVGIIGYGKTSRRQSTGFISRILSRDIEQQPVSNLLDALQGRINGLDIVPLSGLPGSNYKVLLRGRNSIGSGNNPLFILDGVPMPGNSLSWDYNSVSGPNYLPGTAVGLGANMSASPLNVINVADIESIDILKDADATAIYGSRGANGVILITTKKGAVSIKPQLAINIYTGIGNIAHNIDYLHTSQYLQMRREAFANDLSKPGSKDHDVNGDWDTTRYTDWQKMFIGGTAHVTDAQSSISGGTTFLKYLVSGGFRKETTVYPGDFNYLKGGGRVNLTFAPPDNRWRSSVNAAYVSDRNSLPSVDLTSFANTIPNAPLPLTSSGALNWETDFDNPYAYLRRRYTASTDNLLVSASTGYAILPWIEFKANLGYNRITSDEIQSNPGSSYQPVVGPAPGDTYFAYSTLKNWIIEPQLVVDHIIGQGSLSTLVGATFQQESRTQRLLYGSGYDDDGRINDITAAGDITAIGNNKTEYKYRALFGRLSYKLKERYFVNLTGRRDGSSRFGPGRQYANFGALGLAWAFTEEPWFKNKIAGKGLSFGKIRASFGITGNDQIKDYDTYLASAPAGANRNFTWEKVTKAEAGFDLGFGKDRVLVSASLYRNITSNQLIEDTISGIPGALQLKNLNARVENKGFELEVRSTPLAGKNFRWELNASLSVPKNKLLSFPAIGSPRYAYFYSIGQPLDIYKGFQYLGVDPASGLYEFTDYNGDGKIDIKDFQYAAPLGIKYFGSLQSRLRYKGFELSVLVQYIHQTGFDYRYAYVSPGPGTNLNQPATVLDRWIKPGDAALLQQFTHADNTAAARAFSMALSSNAVITGASFLRVRNLALSYSLPGSLLERWHLRSASIYMHGQNLLTITGYRGRSPETAGSSTEAYPPLRLWTTGFQLGL